MLCAYPEEKDASIGIEKTSSVNYFVEECTFSLLDFCSLGVFRFSGTATIIIFTRYFYGCRYSLIIVGMKRSYYLCLVL